jgi:hypothetical protein
MTPGVFSIGVATLAFVLKIAFLVAIREDERLDRQERQKRQSRARGESDLPLKQLDKDQ